MVPSHLLLDPTIKLTCVYDHFEDNLDKFINLRLDTFDHWLSEEEAAEKILSYPIIMGENKDLTEYLKKEQLLLSYMELLFDKYKIFYCKGEDKHFEFASKSEFSKTCRASLREEDFSTYHVPALDLTIRGNFDLSFAFIFARSTPGIVSAQHLLANFPGLYFPGAGPIS